MTEHLLRQVLLLVTSEIVEQGLLGDALDRFGAFLDREYFHVNKK